MKFKIGDKVRITRCESNHKFNIGDIVEITDVIEERGDYRAKSLDQWFIGDSEVEAL